MKITKSQLQQIIKEELSSVLEVQSDDDKERQAAITADAAGSFTAAAAAAKKAADQKKYGGTERSDRYETTRSGQKITIDMLTKLTDMVKQLLQKP